METKDKGPVGKLLVGLLAHMDGLIEMESDEQKQVLIKVTRECYAMLVDKVDELEANNVAKIKHLESQLFE